jgi:hypothetical protein
MKIHSCLSKIWSVHSEQMHLNSIGELAVSKNIFTQINNDSAQGNVGGWQNETNQFN